DRVSGETPLRHLPLVFLAQFLAPDWPAGRYVEAGEVAHRAEGVDLAAADRRRAPRPGRVGNLVVAVVFVLPQVPAGLRVEAVDAFLAATLAFLAGVGVLALGAVVVEDEPGAVGHGRPRVPAGDRLPPDDRRPAGREFLDQPGLAPHAVAFRA